jgi:pilus assembly protein CpaE
MTNAFASRPYDPLDDEFDAELDVVPTPAAMADGDINPREPLQFTAPGGHDPNPAPSVTGGSVVAHPGGLPVAQGSLPAGAGYNPVGDLVAGASAAIAPHAFQSGLQNEVTIPRIAIHVFAERQDTLAAAERAGQDRRMARATTQIRVGGVPAAVDAYNHEPTPPLIIVECMQDPGALLWQVDRLAEVCDAGTKVVVIGATNDIILFRELMKRGVSEYLVAPVQPLQLIAAIGGLFSDPAQPFVGRSIAFVGARGGAGSSSVAHNTAYAMSEKIGANTVIVDYDLPFGTAGLDFNQDPLSGVADALGQPDRLDPVLLDRMMVRCTDKLSLFAAPATLDTDWDISPEAFEEVTTQIRGTAPFIVLDLPHIWTGWMRRTLIAADEVVVVATPDLASLRNAKNMIDLIRSGRPNDAPPRLVLNQVGVPGRPEIPAKDFGAALGVHPSLSIPFDAKLFGAAANNGQMILDAGAKSKAAEAFQLLAQIVSRRELPQLAAPGKATKGESKSLFSGLFKKKT